MKGYVAQRRGRFYAVIYKGRDPVTGRERRTWHPAGTDRAKAERLAKKLAAAESTRVDAVRSLTFGAYLTSQWLPAKKLHLATSTYRGYERNVRRHILPVLGRTSIRRLRHQQIESLYETLLHPDTGTGLAPKTVYEIHLIIRGALTDAHRRGAQRGHPHDAVPRPETHPRQPAHQRRRPREGRLRATRPRPHRPHARDLPARPARHASRRGPDRRTPRRPASELEQDSHEAHGEDVGGTSWEQPEEGRLIRRNDPRTAKAQVADLGFRRIDGGGGRI